MSKVLLFNAMLLNLLPFFNSYYLSATPTPSAPPALIQSMPSYIKYEIIDYNSSKIHALTLTNLSSKNIGYAITYSEQTQTLTEMIDNFKSTQKTDKVIAAINGGFFKIDSQNKGPACYLKTNRNIINSQNLGKSKCRGRIGIIKTRKNDYFLLDNSYLEETSIFKKYQKSAIWALTSDVLYTGPVLIDNGVIISKQEILEDDFLRYENYAMRSDKARSAICKNRKTNQTILFVLEKSTNGANLIEFANIMSEKFNCTFTINLDGGGSSTLYFNDEIIYSGEENNSQRKISNALLIYEKDT